MIGHLAGACAILSINRRRPAQTLVITAPELAGCPGSWEECITCFDLPCAHGAGDPRTCFESIAQARWAFAPLPIASEQLVHSCSGLTETNGSARWPPGLSPPWPPIR